jgi:phage terminase large subunit
LNDTIQIGIGVLRRWRDPVNGCVWFATEELKFVPDPWQFDLFRAMASGDRDKMRIAMKACKGVGKTAALAICILWFMVTQGEIGEHPKGAATSITEDNIDDNLWPEIAKWQSRSKFLLYTFQWTKSRYYCKAHEPTWFFSKRTWPKSGDKSKQASTLAGLHSKYLLFVVDESGDVPDAVLAAADAGLTGTEVGRFQKILQAGNPTQRAGPLYRAAHVEKNLWYVITITGDPDNPNRSTRQSIDWARDQINRYGKDSPWVQVNVFGEFPESAINALFSDADVDKMIARNLRFDAYSGSQKRIGCDVARQGDDNSVLFPRQGLRAFNYVEMSGAKSHEVGDRLITSKIKWGSEMEYVDGTGGFGSGVCDHMTQRGYTPAEINFASKASDPRYANKRAEMYFRMRDWAKRGGQLPQDDMQMRMRKELCATTYAVVRGKIILSPKEHIKSALGFSPDRMDALALTFADPEMVGTVSAEGRAYHERGAHVKTEWDPFADSRM